MSKEDVVNYVMDDPSDTNPTILRQLVDEAASGGSSDDIFKVQFTYDSEIGKIVSDKTVEEIYDACRDNKVVIGFSHGPTSSAISNLSMIIYHDYGEAEGNYECAFSNITGSSIIVFVNETDTEWTTLTFPLSSS